ncbi:FGGY-family carbohydrate kinase [Brevibacillus reuszeri]|uniref:FGGY-family carbohydrate kinase n=1 Tax=Brevibacillus reuszeri TaxID=54915 RepID=UPI000CCC71A3|nr:FGGY-family carbohydrate kinase [Brevibacillus reuszeri]
MSYVMGIDIGTYESKGVLVDREGRRVAYQSLPHSLEIPQHGWAEHDAEKTWWHAVKTLSKALIAEGQKSAGFHASLIEAVGISTIGPAVVPIDHNGNALRKAILYGIDTRASKEIDELNQKIGPAEILRKGGHYLSSQSAGAKILWIRNQEPSVYDQTACFLSGNGYLVYKLTKERVIDAYTACAFSPLFNLQKLDWDDERCAYVTEREKLPRIVWSHEIVGCVTPEAAEATGLSAGTKVIAGTADAMSESISVGAVNEGDMMIMYGSSTFFIQVIAEQTQTEKFWPSVHAVPNLHTLTGGTSTAGSITRWFVDQWLQPGESRDEGYTRLTRLAEQSKPGANGLIMLPYFSGERTPIHHLQARGTWFGLTLKHTTGDLYRAILEGIGYSIRHNIEEMRLAGYPPRKLVAIGGGTKNRLWLQAVSSICSEGQYIPKVTYGAAYGDAFLAALGLGWYDRLEEIESWVEYTEVILPQSKDAEIYEKYYRLYREIYEQTKGSMDALSSISKD